MRELNLNNEITIKLNERGIKRTERNIEEIQNNPDLKDFDKVRTIELWKSRIDENGYLTAPLIEMMGKYRESSFESMIAIVHEGQDSYELNLNNEITIKLNEGGIKRTEQYIEEIKNSPNLTDSSKVRIIKLWKSRIDENGHLTAPLIEIMGKYRESSFESMIAIENEKRYEEDRNISSMILRKR